MKNNNLKSLCLTGLMAALIFVFTFTFKIPIGVLGYAHLGDAFIIVTVWLLGGKKGWIAASIGAAIADFVSGFAIWIVPTFIVKGLMALAIALIAEKLFKEKFLGYFVGVAVGAVIHIAGYSVAWIAIGGMAGLASAIVPLVLQTVIGAVLGSIMLVLLKTSKINRTIKKMI